MTDEARASQGSDSELQAQLQEKREALKAKCLADKDGIFWGTDGMKLAP